MRTKSQNLLLFLTWILVGLIALVPLLTMLFRLVPQPELFPLLWDPRVLKSLSTTLIVSLGSLFLALIIGTPTSYLLTRTNLPYKGFFKFCFLFPFFVPSYLFAIAWTTLAVPKVGFLNRFFHTDLLNVYSLVGIIAVTTNAFFPILITTLSKGFQTMDPSLEEAARVCGAHPLQVFLRVTLPCQLSHIIGASITFVLLVASSFGIPAILGAPAHLFVLTTDIYTQAKMGGLNGADKGFVISLWLAFFALLITSLGRFLRSRFGVPLIGGKASRESAIDLGKWSFFFQVCLLTLVIAIVFLPLLALVVSSFLKVAGDLSWSNFTPGNYLYVFGLQESRSALLNSLSLAFLGAITCCSLGFLVAYFGKSLLEKIASLPFSIPGTVLALSFLASFGMGWGNPRLSFLGSPILLFLAYVAKDLGIAVQNLTASFGHIDKTLTDAARISGAGPMRTINQILTPLLFPSLQGVFLLCALPMISELTMSILLFGPGTETLGTLIFQLQDYANPLAACALSSLVVMVLAAGLGIVRFFGRVKA